MFFKKQKKTFNAAITLYNNALDTGINGTNKIEFINNKILGNIMNILLFLSCDIWN